MRKIVSVRVVIDTNILVPSVYMSTNLYRFVMSDNLVLVWNNFMRSEAKRITEDMWVRTYQARLNTSLDKINELLDITFELGDQVLDMPIDWPPASPDRNDDPFLWASVAGHAEYIISHDNRHMLSLGSYEGIPIGKPKDFFDWVKLAHPMNL